MSALRERLIRVFALDPRSLAVFRMALGALILADLAVRARSLRALYTDDGLFPRATARAILTTKWFFSLHFLGGSVYFEAALFALAGILALMLLAGWRTRTAAALSWMMLLSLQNRNWLILQGGDELLRLLCFWGMFLPLGERFSVDALLRGERKVERGPVCSAASIGLILQLVMMYVFAGLLKLAQPAWRQGLGLVYAFSLREFATGAGLALARHVDFLRWACRPTLWIETLGALLVLCPAANGACRLAAMAIFWAFHAANIALLRVGHFSPVSMAAWLPLLPAAVWDRTSGSSEPRLSFEPVLTAVLALTCVYGLLWNIASVPGAPLSLSERFRGPGWLLGLDQDWNMFSVPIVDDGWYVIPARLAGGGEADLFRGGAPVTWESPESVSALFPDTQWAKYGLNLYQVAVYQRDAPPKPLLKAYGAYLCRDWNRGHSGAQAAVDVQVYFMRQALGPDGRHGEAQPVLLWTEPCLAVPGQPPYRPGISQGITQL